MACRFSWLVSLALSLALLAPAASADGYSRNPALVGHWRHEGTNTSSVVVFVADGTWTASIAVHGSSDTPIQTGGKWLTDENYIYWLYTTASSNSKAKPGTRDRDKLLEINDHHLVLENYSHKHVEYIRVK
jgi:hypothetical protein